MDSQAVTRSGSTDAFADLVSQVCDTLVEKGVAHKALGLLLDLAKEALSAKAATRPVPRWPEPFQGPGAAQ